MNLAEVRDRLDSIALTGFRPIDGARSQSKTGKAQNGKVQSAKVGKINGAKVGKMQGIRSR